MAGAPAARFRPCARPSLTSAWSRLPWSVRWTALPLPRENWDASGSPDPLWGSCSPPLFRRLMQRPGRLDEALGDQWDLVAAGLEGIDHRGIEFTSGEPADFQRRLARAGDADRGDPR